MIRNTHYDSQAPSYYYEYKFVSPEPIYALVKEELKSYFDTGSIDDALFPTYTDKCLKKLKKGVLPIEQTLLAIENNQARLPDDFDSVREAWACDHRDFSFQDASATYQAITHGTTSTRIDSPDLTCSLCTGCTFPDVIQAMYKTTRQIVYQTRRTHLLRPGNLSVRQHLGPHCANIGASSSDQFDIRDNKFTVTFSQGVVHLVYYAKEYCESGYQLVPDEVRIQEYIESYIKYKMFEQLCNQVTDETYKQIEAKRDKYDAEQAEKFVLAEIEMKKQTPEQKHQASRRTMTRNWRYNIK